MRIGEGHELIPIKCGNLVLAGSIVISDRVHDGLIERRHLISVEALGADKAAPALVEVISGLARKNAELLEVSRPFASRIRDGRLALEVDLIQTLADDLNTMLINRDPLSQSVHHSKMDVAALFVKRFPAFALMRLRRPRPS